MTWWEVGSRVAVAARTATVLPTPTSPAITPEVGLGDAEADAGDGLFRALRTNRWRAETVLHEFYRVAFRRRYYRTPAELQTDLARFVGWYNNRRTHSGRRLRGGTPATITCNA